MVSVAVAWIVYVSIQEQRSAKIKLLNLKSKAPKLLGAFIMGEKRNDIKELSYRLTDTNLFKGKGG
jgi:hypothetical protein